MSENENRLNALSIEIKKHNLTWNDEQQETQEYVEYMIDGRSLREILSEQNDNSVFTEGYIGLRPSDFFLPSTHFIGEADGALLESNGSRTILICGDCGMAMCSDVSFELEVRDDYVTWKNFQKPVYDNDFVFYKGGPFVFPRKEYESALNHSSK